MTTSAIPTYALYGEAAADPGADWLHRETILSRNKLHGYPSNCTQPISRASSGRKRG